MLEVSIEQCTQVTKIVQDFSVRKQEMVLKLKQYRVHIEKQQKNVQSIRKHIALLEKTEQTLKIKIQQKKEDLQEIDKNSLIKQQSLEQEKQKLTLQLQQYQSNFTQEQYLINEKIFHLQQKISQNEQLIAHLSKDKVKSQRTLNEQIQDLNHKKNKLKNLQEEQLNKIEHFQHSIQDQEVEDIEELEQVKTLQDHQVVEVNLVNTRMQAIEAEKDRIIQAYQLQLRGIDEKIMPLKSTITGFNQQISDLNVQISKINNQLNQKTSSITIKLSEQEEAQKQFQKTLQIQTLQLKEQQDALKIQFDEISKQISDNPLETLKTKLKQLNDEETIIKNKIDQAKQNIYDQRASFKIPQLEEKQNQQQIINEKNQLKQAQIVLEQRYQGLIESYDQHCSELKTLKSQYETTINNIKIGINNNQKEILIYEEQIKQLEENALGEENDFKPWYHVVKKCKGSYEKEKKSLVDIAIDNDPDYDQSASESDEDHYTLQVTIQTKGKIHSRKKNVIISLENGTYYLTNTGYFKKIAKNSNILFDSRKSVKSNYNFTYKIKLFDEIDSQTKEKLTIKGNKVHRLITNQVKGTQITLKVLYTSQIHMAVGGDMKFFGQFKQDGKMYQMIINDFGVDSQGNIIGRGDDYRGCFKIDGKLDFQSNDFQFFKTHTQIDYPVIVYTGSYQENCFKGRWTKLDKSDDFEIKKTHKIFNYKGSYEQDKQVVDMNFTLALNSKNEVEGLGWDRYGDFTWSGIIQSTGKVLLVKSYETYSVNYKGIAKNNSIEGIWELPHEGVELTGQFYVEESDQYHGVHEYVFAQMQQALANPVEETKVNTTVQEQVKTSQQQVIKSTVQQGSQQTVQEQVKTSQEQFNKSTVKIEQGSQAVQDQMKIAQEQVNKSTVKIEQQGLSSSQDLTAPKIAVGAPGDVKVVKRADSIQNYFGSYEERGQTVQVSLQSLVFTGEGEISGSGKDVKGLYKVQGNIDWTTSNVTITLYYESSYISFIGVQSKTDYSMTGKWSVQPGTYYGVFSLTNTKKIYNYKGFQETERYFGNKKDNMEFVLMLTSKNTVEGQGDDENGKYNWTGTILSDGNVNLLKKYAKYFINYKGTVQGTKIKGKWADTDKLIAESGNFEVEEQQ